MAPVLEAACSWGAAVPLKLASRGAIYLTTLLGIIGSAPEVKRNTILSATDVQSNAPYFLGVGIGDITGPIVETNMFGYASLAQTDNGIHMRQWSRAFIIANRVNPSERIVYINSDIGSGDTAVRRGIIQKLNTIYPGVYSEHNIALVGTHSHSGVGGYLNNLLPQLTSLGFVRQTYDAIVEGTVHAVVEAHKSLTPGYLSLGNTTVEDAQINRSPYSYLANPEEERARYTANVDKTMSLLKFTTDSGSDMGFLSFFAVHGTSLYMNNTLISTDNKGMAAYLYESYKEPNSLPGATKFVAGFTQSTSGDVSPNTLGAFCESPGKPWHGEPCDFQRSTCGGKVQDCHGRGPGYLDSDFKSNEIIGKHQFDAAKSIMESTSLASVTGAVKGVHVYVDMSEYAFTLPNGTAVSTCSPALGFGFAGGTTDGPGAFDFVQGANSSDHRNPFWEIVKGFITPYPSSEDKACHYPKPILLNVGAALKPYQWSPSVVDIQLFRVGQLVMLILPAEFTTMSGRRLREAVRTKLIADGIIGEDAYVVSAGPANTYSHYTTTREEYSVQRYEGASTLYGPNTLDAYINLFTKHVPYLANDATSLPPPGPIPADLTPVSISLQTPVIRDGAPLFKSIGDVLTDVESSYRRGDTVVAVFQGANPRNNLHLEDSFLFVEREENGQWKPVRTDAHPSTTFVWKRTNSVVGHSTVTITWTIEDNTLSGTYRLRYNGDSKTIIGGIKPFTSTTSNFVVE